MPKCTELLKTLFGLLDSPGGHIAICVLLINIGIFAQSRGLDLSKDTLVVAALAILGRSMLGQNGKGTGAA